MIGPWQEIPGYNSKYPLKERRFTEIEEIYKLPWCEGDPSRTELRFCRHKATPKIVRDKFSEANHREYRTMVSDMDHHIGRVLDSVVALGIENSTLIVFASDNG